MLPRVLIVAGVAFGLGSVSVAQPVAVPPPVTLFQNVRVFDGKGDTVSGPTNVLVRGNLIERISATSIAPQASYTVIDGGGRTLMPGLIDMHWHTMMVRPTPAQACSWGTWAISISWRAPKQRPR